jgi:hypothetical protein
MGSAIGRTKEEAVVEIAGIKGVAFLPVHSKV